jgi:hypothetical protein
MSRVKRPVGSKRKNGQGPVAVKPGCARQPVAPATLNCTSEPERRLRSRASQTARSSARTLCAEHVRQLAGESPRTNLMEVKDSEAQGLPSRDGV